MSENLYYLGFSSFPGIGPARFKSLLNRFETAKNAWQASESDLSEVIGEKLTKEFMAFRREFSLADYEQKLTDCKINYSLQSDQNYPALLHQLPNAPFVLYIKGDRELVCSPANKSIAVVGTRKFTSYGQEVTKLITSQLVQQGLTIVSGLAIGIDSVAHATALENSGKTIAVLGCGADCVTPSSNQFLYDRILKNHGAIVSESAFGSGASKGIFPARNRIIAGLSLGVVVTEGAKDSGALITARFAQNLQRPVFAVPGPITSHLSDGPNQLLRSGARVISDALDILQELKLDKKPYNRTSAIVPGNPSETKIMNLLANQPMHFNELAKHSQIETSKLAGILTLMEIKGMIKSTGDGKFHI